MYNVRSISDIREANTRATPEGREPWFSADNMRHWGTRLPLPGICYCKDEVGVLFITSDKRESDARRGFTIRRFDRQTGMISTPGEYQAYLDPSDALAAMTALAMGGL